MLTRPKLLAASALLFVACAWDDAELVGVRIASGGAGNTSGSSGTADPGGTTSAPTSGSSGSSGSASSSPAGGGGRAGEGGSTDDGGTASDGGTSDQGGTTSDGGAAGSVIGEGGTAGVGGVVGEHVRYVYAANGSAETIAMFAVDDATDQMRPRGYVMAGLAPAQVLISPDQRFLFAPSSSGTVGAYAIDAVSGRPSPVAGSPYAVGSGTGAAALDAAGKYLYVASSDSDSVTAFAIDQTSGALTPIGSPLPVGDGPGSVAVSSSGHLYVLNRSDETVSALSIDEATGALTPVGSPVPTENVPEAMVANPDGSALYVSFLGDTPQDIAEIVSGVSSYAIEPGLGTLTAVDTEFSAGSSTQLEASLAVTPSGKYLLVAFLAASDLNVYETGPGGALSIVDPDPYDVGSPADVTIDRSGTRVYVGDWPQKSVYSLRLDPDTGALTHADETVAWRSPFSLAVGHGSQPHTATSHFALVTNQDDDTVSSYGIASDGSLVPGGTVAASNNPVGVGVTPDGSLAIVTNENDNTVASYDSDPATGDLVATGSSVTTGSRPLVVAVDPSGRFAFTSNSFSNSVQRLSVGSDGTLASLGSVFSGSTPVGMAMHPTGAYLFVAERGANTVAPYVVTATTGALTTPCCASKGSGGTQPTWVAVSPSGGRVYVTNFGSNDLSVFGLDVLNNGLTSGTKYATGASPFGVVVDPKEQYIFVANSADDSVTRFRIDGSTLVNLGATPTGGATPMTLATDGNGEHLYVLNQDSDDITVFSIDRATGDLTTLGDRVPTGARPATIVVHTTFQ